MTWLRALILSTVLTLAGCQGLAGYSRELPADWPLPQLTLHPDWELRREAAAMHQLDPVKYPDKQWLVIFDNDGNWAGVVAHVEGALKPLGYLRQKSTGANNPLGLDLPEMRTYYSPDYLTEVLITNGCYFDVLIQTDIEFALSVKELAEPPELIRVCLGHRQRDPKLAQTLLDGILEAIP